ncbi:retropepsin-like aspartic protease family protein [Beggiatoa leptomitoformis]|uniref:TIGR02281 family clan AA aspartic protease n=1 Tax=Beggiatoa leptomitoformis TaxID=288004 RepID=A0A2N9YJQ9_9GAMM|nr:TIGR02281 family clan AA aspartic protease [Beggiatoa leptomitoformis]ALG69362.2 TIGR02281 family clan AA aspartic protease [Beggiatoa leptomitoformis]AUI70703.2 TIGR02281 family clan AA aspartic protease [Beggiatoa leptomitoformis]
MKYSYYIFCLFVFSHSIQPCVAESADTLATSSAPPLAISVIGLMPNKAILFIAGQQRSLKVGQTSPEGVTLISADSEQAILEVNGQQAAYGVGGYMFAVVESVAATEQIVRIPPDSQGMYKTIGQINGITVNFLIDTGANTIAINSVLAQRLGLKYLDPAVEPSSATTASGVVRSYPIELKRVQLGGIVVENLQASVIEGKYPVDVLLGTNFLNKLKLEHAGSFLELRQQ